MKTRAKDNIRLPSGQIITLGEALDRGKATLIASDYYDPPRFFARCEDVSWEVSPLLYKSRTGQGGVKT